MPTPVRSPETTPARDGQGASTAADLARIARPRQWTKNVVCFAALVFAGKLGDPQALRRAALAFLCFCFASSAVYVFNDVRDREEDRVHPVKRERPVAAGRLSPWAALVWALVLAGVSLALSIGLAARFRWVLGGFLLVNLLYSGGLKRVAVVDVMVVATCFVLRVQSGIEAIGAPQSAWIILCMFFMALFLAVGKRRGEILHLPGGAIALHRPVLEAYSVGFLDLLLAVSATTTIVCYSLYAVTVQSNETFLITILPVVFGIVRYLMLVLVDARGEDPGDVLTRDVPLLAAVAVWSLLCIAVLYFGLQLFPAVAGR
ncbi:MAG TPA: decaprenyl-phosphate phosphoribosyltransferase [Candidatus Bathyarchaeia archaeon]|nr:decaprenyl-phosphate phosphoribosyltransferase [Candidatus Bathyarchaeia archaeon]